jgi:hypothetical protein
MHNINYSTPSYNTPCLIHVKGVGWIEAELLLEEDTGDMYYPHCGLNTIKYEVWYSNVSEAEYQLEDVDHWIYINDIKDLKEIQND